MKNDVKWTEQDRKQITGLARKHRHLRDFVRFLAHRAAERDCKAAQLVEDGAHQTRGDSK